MIALRDPAGFTDQVAVFPLPLLDLVSLFDGEHSVAEIQEILRGPATAKRRPPSRSASSSRASTRRASSRASGSRRVGDAIDEAFRQSAVRPAVHAGGAYAAESRRAGRADRRVLHASRGAGDAGWPATDGRHRRFEGSSRRTSTSIGAAPCTRWAYRALLERSDADLFVILGTCHAGMADPFAVTLKPYDTPLGAVPTDRAFCEALGRRYGADLLRSERRTGASTRSSSRSSCSATCWARGPFSIVPVLASYLHEAVWSRGDPERDPRVPRFIDALLGDHGRVAPEGVRDRRSGSGARGATLRRSGAEHADEFLAAVQAADLEHAARPSPRAIPRPSSPPWRTTATGAASAVSRRSTRSCARCPARLVVWCATSNGRTRRAR